MDPYRTIGPQRIIPSVKVSEAKVYTKPFPCRINENTRVIHCDSCELVFSLLEKISELEERLSEKYMEGYSDGFESAKEE